MIMSRENKLSLIEKSKMDDGGEYWFLVVFIQISIIVLGSFVLLAFTCMIVIKLIHYLRIICSNKTMETLNIN